MAQEKSGADHSILRQPNPQLSVRLSNESRHTNNPRKGDIMNTKTKCWAMMTVSMLALLSLLLLAACNKKESTEQSTNAPTEQAAPAAAAAPIDPATVPTVKGTVKFERTAPKPSKLTMMQE